MLAHVKTLYPGNQILWIRDAAAFFNSVLATEKPLVLDAAFTDKPLGYLTKVSKTSEVTCHPQISGSSVDLVII